MAFLMDVFMDFSSSGSSELGRDLQKNVFPQLKLVFRGSNFLCIALVSGVAEATRDLGSWEGPAT